MLSVQWGRSTRKRTRKIKGCIMGAVQCDKCDCWCRKMGNVITHNSYNFMWEQECHRPPLDNSLLDPFLKDKRYPFKLNGYSNHLLTCEKIRWRGSQRRDSHYRGNEPVHYWYLVDPRSFPWGFQLCYIYIVLF